MLVLVSSMFWAVNDAITVPFACNLPKRPVVADALLTNFFAEGQFSYD